MSSKWEIHNPTGDDQTVAPDTTPVLLTSLLTDTRFYPGTTEVQLHNIGPGNVYFYFLAGAVGPSVANMRPLPPESVVTLDWQEKHLKKLWVAADSASEKLVVSQSGI